MGLTTPAQLAEKRPYVIVAAFVLGMVLTPPDIISQVLLAIPMWLLFESGVIASRYIFAERLKKDAEEAAQDAERENSVSAASAAGAASFADDHEVVNDPADAAHEEYEPLTDEEMEAEMDRIDEETEAGEQVYDEDDKASVDTDKPESDEELTPKTDKDEKKDNPTEK